MTIYAIGDVHGHPDKLKGAWDRIADDKARHGTARAQVVHIGDYVDRGPDTRTVIDLLIGARDAGEPFVFLAGNHDLMMARFLDPSLEVDEKSAAIDWFRAQIGGKTTLASYGVKDGLLTSRTKIQAAARDAVPSAHLAFLKSLKVSHSAPGLFFAHAGIRPGVPLADQALVDLMWIRQEFLQNRSNHGRLIVHGHTPVDWIEHHGNRLNIDTGAAWGGELSAVAIEGRRVWHLTDAGRVEVRPDA